MPLLLIVYALVLWVIIAGMTAIILLIGKYLSLGLALVAVILVWASLLWWLSTFVDRYAERQISRQLNKGNHDKRA